MAQKITAAAYVNDHSHWSSELKVLRAMLLDTELVETIKWNIPVYTIGGKNVIGLTGFKNKYGLWFYQGSFLSDPGQLLVNAQAGKTKGMRHIYLQDRPDYDQQVIMSYISEAIENQKAGKVIKVEAKQLRLPEELNDALKDDSALKAAFHKFRKSNQIDFADYISTAKRATTKHSRLAKIKPMILRGEGMRDKYR